MENQKMNRLCGYFFIGVMVLFFLLFFVIRDSSWSQKEQRKLVTLSAVKLSGYLDGSMEENITAYMADQFPLRSSLLSLRSSVAVTFGEREHAGVYRGKSSYLLEKFQDPDDAILTENVAAITAFQSKYSSISHYFILTPTGSEIMKHKLPNDVPTSEEATYTNSLIEQLGSAVTYIDISKTLRNHREEEIYYLTDHHLTGLGTYYAYKETITAMNLDAEGDNFESVPVSNDYQGDLQAISGYGGQTYDTIYCYFYRDSAFQQVVEFADSGTMSTSLFQSAALSTQSQLDVFLGGGESMITINTSAPSGRKILLFGDSEARAFAPFLISTFREIVIIDPELYEGDLNAFIEEKGFSDILYYYHASDFAEDTALAALLNETTGN